jgi:UDP-N-acetylglucosamine 1-carboxyvinyltransferase
MMVLMSQLKGKSTVIENLYQQRYDHASQLEKMGVCLNVTGNTAIIHGSKKQLTGTQVECAGIRESCALILAGLIAEPSTEVNNAAAVNRGYADIVSDLTNLGANIYWGWPIQGVILIWIN